MPEALLARADLAGTSPSASGGLPRVSCNTKEHERSRRGEPDMIAELGQAIARDARDCTPAEGDLANGNVPRFEAHGPLGAPGTRVLYPMPLPLMSRPSW